MKDHTSNPLAAMAIVLAALDKKAFFRISVALVLFVATGCLSGCGSSGTDPAAGPIANLAAPDWHGLPVAHRRTKHLAVADTGNGRVLIYDAPFSTDESASVVLGKADFQSLGSFPGCGEVSANTLCLPTGLGKDREGNLYVVDGGNCRVLQFRPPFTSGMDASVVFGGLNIGGPGSSCFLSTAGDLQGVEAAVDRNGDLWVADDKDSQVVEYVPPFTDGMVPTLAIGQTSVGVLQTIFNSTCNQGGPVPTASTLCRPLGVTFDSQGNLWVSDSENNRVLKYGPPFSTGMAASLELGQPAAAPFTSGAVSGLEQPAGLAFDSHGNLWVAVEGNNQVIEYVPPFSNGMAESMVLSGSNLIIAFLRPTGVAFDSRGNLSVSDSGNNRVLIFAPPFSSGMSASTVLGQTNFTDGLFNQGSVTSSANTLGGPEGLVTF